MNSSLGRPRRNRFDETRWNAPGRGVFLVFRWRQNRPIFVATGTTGTPMVQPIVGQYARAC